MKIAIDISPIVYGTGVSVYTDNLVENLLKIDEDNNYRLFFSSLRRKLDKKAWKKKNSQIVTSKIPPTLADFFWNKLHLLPIE